MVNLEDHTGLIINLTQEANKILKGRTDYDELKSIVVFLLTQLAQSFDETKSSFYHYAIISKTALKAVRVYIKQNKPCASNNIENQDIAISEIETQDFNFKLLNVLTQQQRSVLIMHIVQNMSVAEISRTTNIKRGAVKSMIERSIQIVRNANVKH